jgi:beta-glucanase (GH16 family)
MQKQKYLIFILFCLFGFSLTFAQVDPDTAQKASIDRFSMEAGHLFVRDGSNGLPGPNEPIDFDQAPFITKGLGPRGEHISYYNFDVQSTTPAPIYVLFKEGESSPVSGQLNIVNVIPGDTGYNDFWQVVKVTVPANYVANTVTSLLQIIDSSFQMDTTTTLVNCPIVPDSSTASLRLNGGDTTLTRGWYKNKIVYYFNFFEKAVMADQSGMVPVSPIFVSFNINPGESGGGPPSGFKTETATGRTHNVTATVPSDSLYSPMWWVSAYDNADFDNVYNLETAQAAHIIAAGIADVNCPVVSVASGFDPDTAQKASIDRFSMEAGHLFVRDGMNGLPGVNEPIDFDKGPFFTKGYGPNGELIAYYNFDVQSTMPAPIYVLFREGESMPVQGQLNIIDVIPGDAGYNDFWEVQKVTVPQDYVANTVTSYQAIMDSSYTVEGTTIVVNCPVVPEGSVARKRWSGSDFGLTRGWYKNKVVYYFNFAEKQLMSENDTIHVEGIYVSFNANPGQPGGGPPSGFKTDPITGRAHNIAESIPTDADYSPLWLVNIYDNADFDKVHDLMSAQSANLLAAGAAIVNCPIVAQYAKIDRFSMEAAHLFARDTSDTTHKLPGPNDPVNFDMEPFLSKGLGPNGEHISYYNFDVQPTKPAPIYVLFNSMTLSPINEQHNIIDVIPGDTSYNDFWQVYKVMVPPDYVPNSITSLQGIMNAGYQMEATNILVNCPVVSEGSSAKMRLNNESPDLTTGWYKGEIVYYFNFSEKALMTDQNGMVPLSPIYVSFNINPGEDGGGPPSGFKMDSTGRTHNVVATLPADTSYSPLWFVSIYDNADFDMVHNLASAQSANILVTGAGNVNCPIVFMEPATSVKDDNSALPASYSLKQNYPNPFNPSTQIKFSVVKNEQVTLKIYNSIGQEVAQLVNQVLPAGNYTVRWNAENFASGVYFYTLHTNDFTAAKKMILLK